MPFRSSSLTWFCIIAKSLPGCKLLWRPARSSSSFGCQGRPSPTPKRQVRCRTESAR